MTQAQGRLIASGALALGHGRRQAGSAPRAPRSCPAGRRSARAETLLLLLLAGATLRPIGVHRRLRRRRRSRHRTQWLGLDTRPRVRVARRRLRRDRPATRRHRGARAPLPEHGAPEASRRELDSDRRGERLALHAQAARAARRRAARSARSASRRSPRRSRSGRRSTPTTLTRTPWRRGRRLVDEDGQAARGRRRSRRARSTPRIPKGADREQIGAARVVGSSADPRAGWAPTASSPTRRSARTPAARSRSTASRRSRTSSRARRSSARATTRRSTRHGRQGALRPGGAAAAATAARGRPRRATCARPGTSTARSGRRGGASAIATGAT